MQRRLVRSSVIRSLGYDDTHAVLEIEFLSGTIYRYMMVPSSLYAEFSNAPSKGRYFDCRIRERFPTQRVI